MYFFYFYKGKRWRRYFLLSIRLNQYSNVVVKGEHIRVVAPQVVGDRRENHCARYWWVPRRVVGWVSGYFWGGQQARALARARARARKRVPQAFWDRVAAQTRDAAHEEGEARNRNVSGRETVPGRYREEGGATKGGGGKGEAETICPHMLCPAYVEPQAVRERTARPRPGTDCLFRRERKSEASPVTSPEMSEETSVFVIRKCSRKENWARGVGLVSRRRHEPARSDFASFISVAHVSAHAFQFLLSR